ncbi:hypothetical protein V6Z12_A06G088800 [Gossypium hirsutum]
MATSRMNRTYRQVVESANKQTRLPIDRLMQPQIERGAKGNHHGSYGNEKGEEPHNQPLGEGLEKVVLCIMSSEDGQEHENDFSLFTFNVSIGATWYCDGCSKHDRGYKCRYQRE